jgi:hypothetical protein
MKVGQGHFLQEAKGAEEALFGLAGESHNDVRTQADAGQSCGQVLEQASVALHPIGPAHQGQDLVIPALEWQMKVATQSGQFLEGRD